MRPHPSLRVLTCLLLLSGCGGLPLADSEDGGTRGECDSDGGPCPDGGAPVGSPSLELLCDELLAKTCGEGEGPRCQDAPACAAAELVARYEPDSCDVALSDEVTFPACTYDACEQLVQKVCGGLPEGATCEDAPGCKPARSLLARAQGDDAEERAAALASCQQSLQDDLVFARCAPDAP